MAKLMMMMVVVLVVFASLIAVVAAGDDDAPVLSLTAQEASESEVIEQQDEALAPEPAGDDVLASDRGLLGGRVGYDFSPGRTGGLVVEDRHDDRRRLRNLLDDDVVVDMAPAPEFELAVDRSYMNFHTQPP
mmetsp:Transcript_25972/g.72736  ORF Transcript_25972/g.72736 Transcript_25972/m.72736 type:complete len:132 (-) Transcript_25972:80-475(-)|eukprot:CAMPEP_0119189482 /NCGR_PEP_ID=MMETSP1316-20130426/780_1 /TAXON_ID=41880 /ORGANISM="Pycnococcus provasolii, Strain RCC2336" /LENGTH=131 /DNA_ID=CAMNT_0007184121 /DNA_START=18 /DNA_END=413 /DNA_ORIENTATION=-